MLLLLREGSEKIGVQGFVKIWITVHVVSLGSLFLKWHLVIILSNWAAMEMDYIVIRK